MVYIRPRRKMKKVSRGGRDTHDTVRLVGGGPLEIRPLVSKANTDSDSSVPLWMRETVWPADSSACSGDGTAGATSLEETPLRRPAPCSGPKESWWPCVSLAGSQPAAYQAAQQRRCGGRRPPYEAQDGQRPSQTPVPPGKRGLRESPPGRAPNGTASTTAPASSGPGQPLNTGRPRPAGLPLLSWCVRPADAEPRLATEVRHCQCRQSLFSKVAFQHIKKRSSSPRPRDPQGSCLLVTVEGGRDLARPPQRPP